MSTARNDSVQIAYDLAARVHAKRIVQVGGQAELSVALARAVHASTGGRGGLVVATQQDELSAKRSRMALRRAGVDEYVFQPEGDVRCALQDLEGPFDLVWLDCSVELASDVMAILGNRLREGAVVGGAAALTPCAA